MGYPKNAFEVCDDYCVCMMEHSLKTIGFVHDGVFVMDLLSGNALNFGCWMKT